MNIEEQLQIRSYISITHRHYFSISHVQSAAFFSREAAKIEDCFKTNCVRSSYASHKGYVIGAIFFAVSFLEASINELYCDANEKHPDMLQGLDRTLVSLMSKMWNRGIPRTARYSILEKYEIVLDLANIGTFKKSEKPYQDIKLLVELRNALVHYEPENIAGDGDNDLSNIEPHKFEKHLKRKFEINPLTGAGNPFYPDKCLGHGCAEWAVNSAVAFTDLFFSKIGIKPTYDHVRDLLITK